MAITITTVTAESNKTFKIEGTSFERGKKYVGRIKVKNADDSTYSTDCQVNYISNTVLYLIVGKLDYFSLNGHSASEQDEIDKVVESGNDYTIGISEDNGATYVAGTTLAPVTDAGSIFDPEATTGTLTTVTAYGTCILKIDFPKPLRNLFSTVTIDSSGKIVEEGTAGSFKVLSNIYYRANGSTTNIPIRIDTDTFRAYLSGDGKTLTIEDQKLNMPEAATGAENSIFINYKTFQKYVNDNRIVLTFYDSIRTMMKQDVLTKEFTVAKVTGPTTVSSASAPSRNEIQAEFNTPVLLPTASDIENYLNIIYSKIQVGTPAKDQGPLDIVKVERLDTAYKKLSFTLGEKSTLPNTGATGTVVFGAASDEHEGELRNADGIFVNSAEAANTVNITITIVKPTVLYYEQDKTPEKPNTTELIIEYSDNMTDQAADPSSYLLSITAPTTKDHTPISASFVGTSRRKVKLVFDGILIATAASLKIAAGKNITNDIGDAAVSPLIAVILQDTTFPTVFEIKALERAESNNTGVVTKDDNALVIKFKNAMQLSPDAKAADKYDNYKFVETVNGVINPVTEDHLPDGTIASAIYTPGNNWFRFVLPEDSNYPVFEKLDAGASTKQPNSDYNIAIGYTGLKETEYKFVANTSGNVYPICKTNSINAVVPLINLEKGIATIESATKISYEYKDPRVINGKTYSNEFNASTISKDSFKLYVSTVLQPTTEYKEANITDARVVNDGENTTIEFTIDAGVVDSSINYLWLYPVSTGAAIPYDIFNKDLKGQFIGKVLNNVSSSYVSSSIISISNVPKTIEVNGVTVPVGYPIEVAVTFSNIIKSVAATDYYISFNNNITNVTDGNNVPIFNSYILKKDGMNTDTIILQGYLDAHLKDIDINQLYIRTIVPKSWIQTIDVNNNSIAPFAGYKSIVGLSVVNIDWSFNKTGDLDKAEMTVEYSNTINDSTIPKEIINTGGATLKDVSFSADGIIDLSGLSVPFGSINLAKTDSKLPIFANILDDVKFDLNITKISDTEFTFRFIKKNETDDLTLRLDNINYIQYLPQKYVLTGEDYTSTGNIYACVSSEYNANSTLK